MFNSGWTASLKSVAALYKTNDISLPLFYCHFNYALSNIWEFELQHLSRGHWKNRQMNTAAVSLLRQQWHTHWRIRATNVLYKPLCPFEHSCLQHIPWLPLKPLQWPEVRGVEMWDTGVLGPCWRRWDTTRGCEAHKQDNSNFLL